MLDGTELSASLCSSPLIVQRIPINPTAAEDRSELALPAFRSKLRRDELSKIDAATIEERTGEATSRRRNKEVVHCHGDDDDSSQQG